MAKNKLFVGGLAWATDEHSLRQAFEKFGSIQEAKVITDRDTGRSRGFRFVSFDNEDDAQEAMRQLDDTSLDGRNIRVNEATDKPRGGGGGGGSGGYRRDSSDSGGGHDTVKRRGGGGNRW